MTTAGFIRRAVGRRQGHHHVGLLDQLARALHARYGCAVLVKGGHGANRAAVDVLYDGAGVREFALPWVERPVSTHGTGCSLGAALAAELAAGRTLDAAVAGAKAYVHGAIANSYLVGANCGVLGLPAERILV